MSKRSRKSFLNLFDAIQSLESRRLLAVAFATNNPVSKSGDFTGPTSSVGSDGYTDIQIKLENLPQKQVVTVLVSASLSNGSSVKWKYGENKEGFQFAEFIRKAASGNSSWPTAIDGVDSAFQTAYVYVNPPGGSATISSITVDITYENGTTESTGAYTSIPSGLHQIVADTSRPIYSNVPTLLQNAAEFQTNQFYGTETSSVKKGDIQIKLNSLPDGKSFSNIQEMYLYDGSGAAYGEAPNGTLSYGGAVWSSTYGRGAYRLSYSNQTSYMDIYAQPIRNELGATMTLVVKFTDNSSFYTQFPGKTVDVTLAGRTNGFSEIQNEKSY